MIRSIGILISLLISVDLMSQEGAYDQDSLVVTEVVIEPLSGSKLDRWNGERLRRLSNKEVEGLLRNESNKQGYVLASISFETDQTPQRVVINPGSRYRWSQVQLDNGAVDVLRRSRFNINRLSRKEFSPDRLGKLFNKALKDLENNGFPFAEIWLDSVQLENQQVSGIIKVDQGPFVQFDSLNLIGDLKIRESYISNYTGIKEGKPYDERAIRQARNLLSQNQFLTVARPLEVRFDNEKNRGFTFFE